MRLNSSGHQQPVCAMADARFVKGLAHGRDFARGQKSADIPEIGLENIVRLVRQTLAERVEPAESFSAGNENVHFPRKPRRALKIVARKRLFQPIDTDFLQRLGGG